MRLIFAGTPPVAARTLRALVAAGHDVALVVTRPDAPVGRKQVMTPSAVAMTAADLTIPVFKTTKFDQDAISAVSQTGATLGVIVAFGALLRKDALGCLAHGWVNLHYSLLPHWRGAAPVQRAIEAGDVDTGVTLFQLDEGMDTGPVFASVSTAIEPGETAGRLLERLSELGVSLLLQELPRIESGFATATVQPTGLYPLANKLGRAEAQIDWTLSARQIEHKVRAFNPEPMAHTTFDDQPIRILEALALGSTERPSLDSQGDVPEVPGLVHVVRDRVSVVCADGSLLLLQAVQPAGKKPMSACDWVRGVSATRIVLGGAQ